MKSLAGSVFRVPFQEAGAMATCRVCDWSRFFPNRKRKRGTSFRRAMRALLGHVRLAHPGKVWVPE